MSVSVSVDMKDVLHEIGRLADGPGAGETTFRLEAILLGAFAATQERVHVMTGHLKSSGHPQSSFDGDVWEGTLAYARYPGIYELARGDQPTQNHPEGQHGFFLPAYHTEGAYEEAITGFLEGSHA